MLRFAAMPHCCGQLDRHNTPVNAVRSSFRLRMSPEAGAVSIDALEDLQWIEKTGASLAYLDIMKHKKRNEDGMYVSGLILVEAVRRQRCHRHVGFTTAKLERFQGATLTTL